MKAALIFMVCVSAVQWAVIIWLLIAYQTKRDDLTFADRRYETEKETAMLASRQIAYMRREGFTLPVDGPT